MKQRPGFSLIVANVEVASGPFTLTLNGLRIYHPTPFCQPCARAGKTMRSQTGFWWAIAAVLTAALVLRLAAGVWWQQRLPEGHEFGFPDSEGYWTLGRAVAQGRPYEFGPERYRVFRTPGYPLVLAPLFVAAGDDPPIWAARALSAVLGTLAVAAVAWLGALLYDQKTALVAAGMAAVYPEAIALGTFVLSEAPFCPLMVLQLVAWTKAWQATETRPQALWAMVGGVAGGLATLMRPSWLLFLPFAAVIGLIFIADRKRQLAIAAVMLAAFSLTMSPWWIRNYIVAGRFVPTSLQVGASLYDGLNPQATGASDMRFVPEFVAEQRAADEADASHATRPQGLFEDLLDRRMRDASLAWAFKNPQRVLELAGVKLARMWNMWPNAAEFRSGMLRLMLAVTYGPVILLAFAGVWKFSRRGWPFVLCWLPAMYFTGLHVIFVSSIRYRQPAMLPLLALAAGVVVGFIPIRHVNR